MLVRSQEAPDVWILILHVPGVSPDQIFCDGWAIGYDERFPQKRRVQQALVFARYSEHDNLYAHPMVYMAYQALNPRIQSLTCQLRIFTLYSTLTPTRFSISVSFPNLLSYKQ